MRNTLKVIGLAAILALSPVLAGAAEAPAGQAETAPAEDGADSLDAILQQMEQTLGAMRSAVKGVHDSASVLAEGTALAETIQIEAARVADLEAACMTGSPEDCTKSKRDRCPLIGESYRNIEARFAAFNTKVAESAFPEEVKAPITMLSEQLRTSIKQLKEQLEQGSCIEA